MVPTEGAKNPDFLSSLNEKFIKGEYKIGIPLNSSLASLASTVLELSLISISEALINQSSCPTSHVVIDAPCNLFEFRRLKMFGQLSLFQAS